MTEQSPDRIAEGRVVSIHYTLKLDSGEEIDTSRGAAPLDYLHGAMNIVPGLERQLDGAEVGATMSVNVAAADGYGDRQDGAVQEVPKDKMPEGVTPGMPLQAQGADGQTMVVHVMEVRDDVVVVDLNHPLAGQNLNFDVEVMAIRDATPEEVEHGHPHGEDGHDH